MDRNTILAIALSIAVYSLWLGFQTSQRPEITEDDASRQVVRQEEGLADSLDDARVIGEAGSAGPAGSEPQRAEPGSTRADAASTTGPAAPVAEAVALWKGTIEGEHFVAELTNRGAALTGWRLRDYWQLEGRKQGAFIELVNLAETGPAALSMPLRELGLGDLSTALFEVERATASQVVFVYRRDGTEVRKTYDFDLEGYGVELSVEVRNGSGELVAPDFAIAWPAARREGNDYTEQSLVAVHAESVDREPVNSVGSPGFFGGLFSSGEQEVWRDVQWAGADLKYFAALVRPDPVEGTRATFEPIDVGESAMAVLRFAPSELAPGQTARRRFTAFLGPKQPELLDSLGRDLSRVVDLGYSWFEPLTLFFQWLLHSSYRIVPNYGWSIVLITILVRLLTLPIMNRQMRSMEKMRALQPRMKEIQAKFADDKQKQSEAMMAMYKETGVNPLGGCLPMILQFPVFIGLFFALQSSFDLRQAHFMLWIDDLSAPDLLFTVPGLDLPFRLLPIIMGASMVLQQKLTPTTVDPSQQMMMMVMMPIMMTVLFYQFPSGLVLYWMVSNFLGIAHQLLIGRRMKRQEQAA